ncbi:site-specific recombinase XerD [Paraburkholderia eburnea]|uniref:Site-specific recombinase XerD n=1 Tax=Paraburkholderia eburnea TaxID=1189126 RepID=A0A2S4MN60_9BURK|nr:site-specific integrase [Paraburkholderia eburnea]POR56204.1 site-specific recombinase XerD [Paraburkholderia eburnea]PRZ27331.1 site-specific recombinase XerD [Paraburkholderia eburnea]
MSQTTEIHSSTALVIPLSTRVFTRSGSSFDPREDVWEWVDGPFNARIDFSRYTGNFKAFVPALKRALLPFVKGHSSAHVLNLNQAFSHFTDAVQACQEGTIGAQHISNYAAKLGVHEIGRLGTLNGLLQKWVDLGLPGVEPECATYLLERRKPGNKKGEAVRTRDPVAGPLSEEEYTALHSAVNAAYGRGALALWTLLLVRLLLACGGRISQYASLKLCDFESSTSVLSLPQAKTGLEHTRSSFLPFDISPQTGRLITEYKRGLQAEGYADNSAFFPQTLVMPRGPRKQLRAVDDLFYGHCTPEALSGRFKILMEDVAPPTSRLDFAPMPLTPKRFRYTFGTRLAEEGASKVHIAERLGHVDLQQVDVYVAATPRIVGNIDRTMGPLLIPLAQAFKGQVVEDEQHATHKGASGSRIIDFRVSKDPVGSCAGKGKGCALNKPVACYACFRFEPWLDAPHEKVLARLESERENWSTDDRMAAVNDEPIRAVKEVIALCAQIWQQRSEQESETAS